MNVSVYAHIRRDTGVTVSRQQDNAGEYVTLETGDLAVFIHSREKLLELASLLDQAAQRWGDEV